MGQSWGLFPFIGELGPLKLGPEGRENTYSFFLKYFILFEGPFSKKWVKSEGFSGCEGVTLGQLKILSSLPRRKFWLRYWRVTRTGGGGWEGRRREGRQRAEEVHIFCVVQGFEL